MRLFGVFILLDTKVNPYSETKGESLDKKIIIAYFAIRHQNVFENYI